MTVKSFDYLPEEAQRIRTKVFIEEQGFKDEFDKIDRKAIHLVCFENEKPTATCRIFKGEADGEYILGRLAVIKEYRGKNIGAKMIESAENTVRLKNGKYIILHSQLQAKVFYSKQGYTEFGEVEDEEGCPHIWMKKILAENSNV